MKLGKLAIALAAVAIGVVAYLSWPDQPQTALIPPPATTPEGELRTTAEQQAVFKRAFWRRPTPDDRINNATLSEWVDATSQVSRWQWFIEVEPSPALKSYLVENNPFSLLKSDTDQLRPGATAPPEWFPKSADGFDIHDSPDGRMSLLVGRDQNIIYATASGYGFASGAPGPMQPMTKTTSPGRLPPTPPPKPSE